MSDDNCSRKPSKAAGGWGALKSVVRQLQGSGAPVSGAKTLLSLNQADGFDCPGCAWGDPEHGSSFEFCENGVKAVTWEATRARVTPQFFAEHTVTELRTWTDHALEHQGRLTHPMSYNADTDRYEEVSWDEAFADIAAALNDIYRSHDLLKFRSFGYGHSFGVLSHYYGREASVELREDVETVLEPGMVVSMEPMIMIPEGLPGAGGYREHDILIVGEDGADNITWYAASDEAERGFCKICGSSLFWKRHNSDRTSIMAGTFDNPTNLKSGFHIYCADKGDYYEISDGLPQFLGAD